ncbi:hypothetical protein LF599_07630 [Pseudodesulfovibrio thermohalotolerans]|uniref:hypothetical protein n=1 Tax=Pseudodesulfovibrio thermohalotolerans TaxID=2880651 RepID=UPI0022B9FC07|nr:hypothetical protein [Pseudodesulfovibrio thermohalotolerans]WFS64025.1 hypothetical protein LF599_07630 [Pseudodesulfovibrio thermohalotolerans]
MKQGDEEMDRRINGDFQGLGYDEEWDTMDMRFHHPNGYSSSTYIKDIIYGGVSLREHNDCFSHCIDNCGAGKIDVSIYGLDINALELYGDYTDSVVFVIGSTLSGAYTSDRHGELGWMKTKRFNNRPAVKGVFSKGLNRWIEEGLIESENRG